MSQTLHTVYSPNGEKRAEVESGLLFLSVYCYDGNLISDVYHVSEIHQAKLTSYKSFYHLKKFAQANHLSPVASVPNTAIGESSNEKYISQVYEALDSALNERVMMGQSVHRYWDR